MTTNNRVNPGRYVALAPWIACLALALPTRSFAKGTSTADDLKLLISVESQVITTPFPLRVTLHFHNSGREALWLYRRVQNQTTDGSTATVELEPVEKSHADEQFIKGQGKILEWAALPRPKLVRLAAGEDYEERAVFRLVPALLLAGEERPPVWGRYRLRVKYAARYSNTEEVARNLGVTLWQGEITSNIVDLDLRPSGREASGAITGRVITAKGHGVNNARVSLSNRAEQLIDQVVTGYDGEFSFTGLPLGLYWITARQEGAREDTVVFRHMELTEAAAASSIELFLTAREVFEPKSLFHKPVLLRVTDPQGRPMEKVSIETTWSDGAVVDAAKGQTLPDGTLTLELVPGRHAVSFKRKGCKEQTQPIEVTTGSTVDAWALVLECLR